MIISEIWKYVHNEYPAPRNLKAAGSCGSLLARVRRREKTLGVGPAQQLEVSFRKGKIAGDGKGPA